MVKLLYVEDDEMHRDMLSRRLIKRGYQVVIAEDGRAGIEMAAAELPDIILMDMSLPVINGWDAVRQLKACADLAQIPVVGLTAHALQSDQEKCLAAGCDDVDTKPVNLTRLLEKIERLLASNSTRHTD